MNIPIVAVLKNIYWIKRYGHPILFTLAKELRQSQGVLVICVAGTWLFQSIKVLFNISFMYMQHKTCLYLIRMG